MTRRLRTGVALALVYAATVAVTLGVTTHHVRPLYEGIGGAPAYQWVKPPPAFAPTNIKPRANTTVIHLTGGQLPQSGVASEDSQLLLNLVAGSIAVPAGATALQVRITPLDPGALGPVPKGLASDGNAYRVQLSFTPGGATPDKVSPPGNIVLTVPHAGLALLASDDGRSWQRLPSQQVGGSQTVLGAAFGKPGYYLGATSPDIAGASGGSSSSGNGARVALIAGLTVVIALALAVVPVLVRRRRQS